MVVHIGPTIRWRVRTALALALVRLATRVLGVGLRVEKETEVDV